MGSSYNRTLYKYPITVTMCDVTVFVGDELSMYTETDDPLLMSVNMLL